MAVRVNKGSFNIREKLTELGRRFGLKGSELAAAETAQEARDLVSAGRKNLVINGACQIHQRGGTTTDSNGYPVDRFSGNVSALDEFVSTFSQSTDAPAGFSNSIKVQVNTAETSLATDEFFRVTHRIEAQNLQHLGFGSSSAKSITVSFWVKSSIPGAYAFHIWQGDTNEIVNSRYYINAADTWEYKTFTYSGNSGGAINNDNGIGLVLNWVLSAGGNYTAESGLGANWDTYNSGSHFAAGHTVNFCGSTSNEFYLTGVQLEVGENATEFEHRSYGEELALCQRYYIHYALASSRPICTAAAYQSTRAFGVVHLPVTMRDNPTVVASSGPDNFRFFSNGGSNAFSTLTLQETSHSSVTVETSNTLSVTAGHAGWIRTDAGTLAFNAEL